MQAFITLILLAGSLLLLGRRLTGTFTRNFLNPSKKSGEKNGGSGGGGGGGCCGGGCRPQR